MYTGTKLLLLIHPFIIPPAYEVYKGYIVLVFSVIVCVCVCLCKLFFSSKFSQELLNLGFLNLVQMMEMTCCIVWVRISLLMLIIPIICPFFFLSNQIFCNRFLGFYESQSLQISYTPEGWPSVLWDRKPRCWHVLLPSFSVCPFFHLSLQYNIVKCVSKISQELLRLGFWNLVQMLGMTCCIV